MQAISSAKVIRQLLPMALVGLTATTLLFAIVFVTETSNVESRFRELADQRIIAIRANIAIAQGSVDLVAGHFAVAPPGTTSREDFSQLVEPTLAAHSFIQGLSWNPRVLRRDRDAIEAAARRDGLADFRLTERDSDGKPQPVAEREEYIPIHYMEPIAANMKALGFDLASHPVRRQALAQGRDLGRPQATGRITLVQENADQYGVLVLAPVFGKAGPRGLDSNRRNLTGYVSGVFRIGDLINASTASIAMASAMPLVDIHLFDMSGPEGERRLHPRLGAANPEELTKGPHVSETFLMAGRSWVLVATPSPAFVAASRPMAAFAMLAVALLATVFYLSFLKGRITQAEIATAFAREVERAKRRLSQAQRIARLVSMELDPDRGEFKAGEGAAEMLGLSPGTECGSFDLILPNVHPGDRTMLRQALSRTAVVGVDVEFRIRADDAWRSVHAMAGEADADGRGIIILQDVSARRAAEEERAAMIERIAESDRFEALGTLAGGIAHEINTPTQYVGDNITFMKDGLGPLLDLARAARAADQGGAWEPVAEKARGLDLDFLAAELPTAADQALDGTARIAKIVQAIKEFSYPSSKTPRPVDLNHLIDVVATVTRNQWKYVAELEYDLAPALPKIQAIEGEINQVLVNLIVNAAQAIAEHPGTEPGRIVVRTRAMDDLVELSIRDNGPGIAPEHLKHIFEMFFTTKAPGQGTGQGLAITRAILHRHGGQISVESSPGSGACFLIHLPIEARGANAQGLAAQPHGA
ncbi:hypothetical protein A6A04_12025 [Paramagnetospirillum marisnigri]|uniref:histidine kinase n=1 Tax=Paramagnetospirillum marisnigri TaxID=1285242 RepID=A0A178MVS6_9PROT|nr:CHASE domain-containing protein [Paramagnetospirillum marisnigri]OAN54645.1 hypothetical protein A6A04_12025 [Paramagnetospirillum marisnigri]